MRPRIGEAWCTSGAAIEMPHETRLIAARLLQERLCHLSRHRRASRTSVSSTTTRVYLRLGAEQVSCIYRRSRTECPARAEEVHHAEEEGVDFHWLTAPVEILEDGRGGVRGMRCSRMELGAPDESGRRRPVPVSGSEHEIETDLVVFAIGTNANPIIGQTSKLRLNKRGYIETDDDLATSMAGVFAGGDIVTGAATCPLLDFACAILSGRRERCPERSRQCRGQTSHCARPSSVRCQSRVRAIA
jgi:hypothetical protein